MRFRFHIVIAMLTMAASALSQDNEQGSDYGYIASPGLYLSYADFITNSPIDPELIITDRSPTEADFYLQVFREGKIEYVHGEELKSVNSRTVWGYSDGRYVYVSKEVMPKSLFENPDVSELPFVRIDFFGTLALIRFVKNLSSRKYYTGVPGMVGGYSRSAEVLFDTRDGNFYKATDERFAQLIADDVDLLREFKKDKKNRDIRLYVFLRKYNDRHPFTFR